MGALLERWIDFLEDHRLVRRWAVPVLFMAMLLFPLFLLNWTARQAAELTVAFLVMASLFALGGLVLQLLIERYVRQKRR